MGLKFAFILEINDNITILLDFFLDPEVGVHSGLLLYIYILDFLSFTDQTFHPNTVVVMLWLSG